MLPLLSRGVIDRAAHRRTDEAWLAAAWRSSRVLVMDTDGRVPVDDAGGLRLLDPGDVPAGERWFLGQDADGTPYFAVHAEVGASSSTLRELALDLSDADAELVSTALALVNWHASHVYSPVTGTPAVTTHAGWVRSPEGGGPSMFPRTDPAMIVLVTDGGDQCLLARGAGRPANWYSCLAGFVEPGESAEACVAREVQEEVGLAVRDITYVVSQPWPFPASLMLGFYAVADPADPIQRDPGEIADARWFTRAELRDALEGRSPDMATPGAISVAHHLMSGWAYR
ncbi:putative NADH pyrophosphatase/NUDIX hydrolase [Actinorhabdospora filicis]|uniref:NAD(+) diphosphatase n=1 Tax=Actinorhabdospora filicis TaxID=1785913 RepID=A0A9W6STV7_9ACTN|nr:NAD(+) diphosphatase [Actinorhabdospora filicis]GLZ81973.1 putative NADH pyrophosphatase/NUDIX hydrolase [Actinorhabdospora filicis]